MSDCDDNTNVSSESLSDSDNTTINTKCFDAKNHYSKIVEKLLQQKITEEFCDVVLIVENKRFPAHRNILSVFSDYFHKMFTTDMKEKQSRDIKIENVSIVAMEIILASMYSGKFSLSEQAITDALHAASLMQVTIVIEAVKDYLIDVLNPENCCYFRDLAYQYSFNAVINQINDFILRNFDNKSIQTDFINVKFEDVCEFLSSDHLTIEEEKTVFEFIVNWVEHSTESRKQHFPTLFEHVRIQFIPIKYVADIIEKNYLVREFHECRNIVGNAFSFYFTPNFGNAQKHRKYFGGIADSFMLLSYNSKHQQVYDLETKKITQVSFEGFDAKTVLSDSAKAENFPITVFCGGLEENSKATNQVVRFDGIRWLKMPEMKECRCGAAAVFYNDDLYVFGGEKASVSRTSSYSQSQSNPDESNFSFFHEKFSNHDWKLLSESPYRSRSYSAALVLNKIIYLIGGYCLSASYDKYTSNSIPCKFASSFTLIFSPEENKWEEGANMLNARAEFGAIVLNKKIIVVGGYGLGNRGINSTEIFNPVDQCWTIICASLYLSNYNASMISKVGCVNGNLYMIIDCKLCVFDIINQTWKEVDDYGIISGELMFPYAKRFHLRPILLANKILLKTTIFQY